MTKFIKILAPAKINLCLDVLKRTASGYHKIQTVFQEAPEIYDEIKIESTKKQDSLSIIYSAKFSKLKSTTHANNLNKENIQILKNSSKNLAFRALQLLRNTLKNNPGLKILKKFAHISIKKNIPISSGLGGASSDAAAVLKGLNKLWNLKLSQKKLLQLAAKLGKDVPFFIIGGTALGTNYGEKITPLPPIKNIKFKIFPTAQPKAGALSFHKTQSAYATLDLTLCGKNNNKTKNLITAIKKNDTKNIIKNLHNDFETLKPYNHLPKTYHLSGSGPSTFTARLIVGPFVEF